MENYHIHHINHRPAGPHTSCPKSARAPGSSSFTVRRDAHDGQTTSGVGAEPAITARRSRSIDANGPALAATASGSETWPGSSAAVVAEMARTHRVQETLIDWGYSGTVKSTNETQRAP